jgi:hypothetical protein
MTIYDKQGEGKMDDSEFWGDTENLIRSDEAYDRQKAYRIVKEKVIDRLAVKTPF